MKMVLSLFRAFIIGINIILISNEPSTELEIELFFASKLVFFLMLFIDYCHVAYYNRGLDRIVGLVGAGLALFLSIIDTLGFFGFVQLFSNNEGIYYLKGIDTNFLTSWIPEVSAMHYYSFSTLAIVALLGFELINLGKRYIPALKRELKEERNEQLI